MELLNWGGLVQGLFGGALGGVATVSALSRWLGDVWLGRILTREKAKYTKELERLRADFARELEEYKDALERSKSLLGAEIEKSVFVTRVHFETEFAAYKQVWEALAPLRLAMEETRPIFSISPRGETDEEKRRELAQRLRELSDAHKKAVNVVENLRPFYPTQVHVRLLECMKAAWLEGKDIQTAGDETFTINWYEQGAKRRDQFMDAYSAVSDMIRARIETLAILPRA